MQVAHGHLRNHAVAIYISTHYVGLIRSMQLRFRSLTHNGSKTALREKTFPEVIEVIYTGTIDDPYIGGDCCFEVTNRTNESVYFWGYDINTQDAVIKQDGRIFDVTSTPEPNLMELKAGESHGFSVTVPP